MAYTTIDNPELYFQTKLYTGNGGTQSITLDGSENMQPDWVWLKKRNGTTSNHFYDSVRGATNALFSDQSDATYTASNLLTAFNTDGFTVGNDTGVNNNNDTFVAWNWKAGTSFSNDASATSVGTIDSAGSVSTTAGFSIISYTGTGSAGTVAHGLGSTLSLYIVKNRSSGAAWRVFVSSLGADKILRLSTTHASSTDTNMWNNTLPTSSIFSIGTPAQVNTSGENYIAYCFAEKKGYSKFGSYTGNGNADGTFIYTGFKPAWGIFKRTDNTADWYIYDNKRNTFNVLDDRLEANNSDAEAADGGDGNTVDFLSNGFKLRGTGGSMNDGTFIYMCFAESPLVNSNGVPNNAR